MSNTHRNLWNALVLDAHSSAGIEIVQSLGRHGVTVDVASCESSCLAFYSRYAHRTLVQPTNNNFEEFSRWIHALHAERNYDLIVPATETSLTYFLSFGPSDLVRSRAVLPSNRALEVALDKNLTAQLASSLCIPIPRSVAYHSLSDVTEEPVSYPVVLKPARSKVLVKGEIWRLQAAIVGDAQERSAVLCKWLPHIGVQEQMYVPGRGIGIELLFNQGRKVWHFAHERVHEYPLSGGASTYRKSISPDSRMLAAAEAMLAALQWHGLAMVEFKVESSGKFYLLEINPRPWGSMALAVDAGVDFPWGLLLLATQQQLPLQPAYKIGHYTRNIPLDLGWQKQNLVADHSNALLLTRGRVLSMLEFFRIFTGSENWDHFDWCDPKIAFHILGNILWKFIDPVREVAQKQVLKIRMAYFHRRLLRKSALPKSILFICYGNICRSPAAEYMARLQLHDLRLDSAGFYEHAGRPCPIKIVRLAAKMGFDLSGFRSREISGNMVDEADLILAMDINNYAEMNRRFPKATRRTTMLGLFSEQPTTCIPDPYSSSEEETEKVLQTIQSAISGLKRWLEMKR